MYDTATRGGVTVDIARLSEALGVPFVTSIAVRKGGTADLLRRTDEIAAQAPAQAMQNLWQPLTVAQLRATQREADRIIAATVSLPARPESWTARIDAVGLHPVAGPAILARIPVYTLIISAFIPDRQVWGWVNLRGLVMFGLYAAGIASALGVSFLIKFFMWRDYAPAPFMLELPDYKMPRLKSIAIGVYTRAKMFLQRAGTTIFSMMVLIWFLASFPTPPAGAAGPAINYSLAAMIGKALEPLLAPLGFNWQIAVALIPGMAAREVAVAALGTVYAIEGGKEAAEQIGQVLATKWSLATALSLLAWDIFAPQCASTLAVIRRETGSWKWMFVTFGYMLTLAYIGAFITYQLAVALGAG